MRSKRKRLLPTSSASPRLIWNVVWMWLSTSPGVTTRPRAEITRGAGCAGATSSVFPTAMTRPSATATAPSRRIRRSRSRVRSQSALSMRRSAIGSRRPSDRRVAAAHADGLAGDPGGQVGGEEGHQRRDVVGPSQPLDRVGLQDPLAVGVPEARVGVARLDPAERDRVDRDAGAPELARERAREGEHTPARRRRDAELRRRRDAELRLPDARRVARDVDDASPLALDHPGSDRVAAVQDAVEADVDLRGPLLGAALEEELAPDHA